MNISRLELTRFCQFRHLILDLKAAPSRPLSLILGNNGFGKSNLLKAFRTAFTGFPADDAEAVALMNRADPDEAPLPTSVTIEFTDSESRYHRLERHLAPGDRPGSIGTRKSLLTTPDGPLRDEDAIFDRCSAILPASLIDYFFFDIEESTTLRRLVGDYEGQAVSDALEQILGLNLFRRLGDDLKKLQCEISRETPLTEHSTGTVERQIAETDARILELEDRIDKARKKRLELERLISDVRRRQRELLVSYDPRIEDRRTRLRQEADQARKEYDALRETIGRHTAQILPLRLMRDLYVQCMDEIDVALVRRSSSAHSEMLESAAGLIARDLGQGGPPLGAPLDTEGEKALLARIRKVLDIGDGQAEGDDAVPLPDTDLKHIRALCGEAIGSPALADLLDARDALKDRIDRIQGELPGLDQNTSSAEAYAAAQQEHDDLQSRLLGVRDACERDRADWQSLKQTRVRLETELKDRRRAAERASRAERAGDLVRRARECVGELARSARLTRVQAIEDAATEAFLRITNKPLLYKRVEIDQHSFAAKLFDVRGREVPKPDLSTGEKTVLAFAIMHGLQRASQWRLPLVIEAPLKPLDPLHANRLLTRFLSELGDQVILLVKENEVAPDDLHEIRHRIGLKATLTRPVPDAEISEISMPPLTREEQSS